MPKKFWKYLVSFKNGIFACQRRRRFLILSILAWGVTISTKLESCAEKVSGLVSENKSLQEQITKLRYQLYLEVVQRENLERKVGELRSRVFENERNISTLKQMVQKAQESEALLKLYDLCFMFNYYKTIPVLTVVGCTTYQEFVSTYANKMALVKDGDMTKAVFDRWLQPLRDQLGDVDIEQVVHVSRVRHDFAHTDLLARTDQENYLSFCKTFYFGGYNDLALKIITQLESVTLKRMK